MQEGLRTGAWSGGGGAGVGDYIQENLVGLYDAENNYGIGVQDPTQLVLKDLVSGGLGDITLNDVNTVISGKKVEFDNHGYDLALFTQTLTSPRHGGPKTVEVVYRADAGFGNNRSIFTLWGTTLYKGGNAENFGTSLSGNDIYSNRIIYSGLGNATMSMRNNGGVDMYFLHNGELSSVVSSISISSTTFPFAFGNYNAARNTSGALYCIREYATFLSDEDIQHNYAVDAARFGLT